MAPFCVCSHYWTWTESTTKNGASFPFQIAVFRSLKGLFCLASTDFSTDKSKLLEHTSCDGRAELGLVILFDAGLEVGGDEGLET